MSTLVLLRHGQSESNRDNLFTGWSDVELTPKGVADAEAARRELAESGLRVDVCFSSVLQRGVESARAAMRGLGQPDLPIEQSWRLNERHFGALQDMSRRQAVRRYGPLRVRRWRQSYSEPPPELDEDDPRARTHDERYASLCEGPVPYCPKTRSPSFLNDSQTVAVGSQYRSAVDSLSFSVSECYRSTADGSPNPHEESVSY